MYYYGGCFTGHYNKMKFERLKEILKAKYYKDLCKFMNGQTCDANGIYEEDFLRWFYKLGVID